VQQYDFVPASADTSGGTLWIAECGGPCGALVVSQNRASLVALTRTWLADRTNHPGTIALTVVPRNHVTDWDVIRLTPIFDRVMTPTDEQIDSSRQPGWYRIVDPVALAVELAVLWGREVFAD